MKYKKRLALWADHSLKHSFQHRNKPIQTTPLIDASIALQRGVGLLFWYSFLWVWNTGVLFHRWVGANPRWTDLFIAFNSMKCPRVQFSHMSCIYYPKGNSGIMLWLGPNFQNHICTISIILDSHYKGPHLPNYQWETNQILPNKRGVLSLNNESWVLFRLHIIPFSIPLGPIKILWLVEIKEVWMGDRICNCKKHT